MGYGADVSGGMIATSGSSAYAINRSLRFRASAGTYLNRTFVTPTNNKIWTWSGWIKRGSFTQNYYRIMASSTNGDEAFRFGNDNFQIFFNGASSGNLITTQVFRDPGAWYHFVVAVDTTQSTASNRVKIYVNGSQITSFSTASYPSQNYNTSINAAGANLLSFTNGSEDFDGYLAEVNFVDGQALSPFAFGNFNPTTGVWGATKYVGTYGTNGFYLPFTNNTALTVNSNTGLGQDFSGNGNYWVTNNISISTVLSQTVPFTVTGSTTWIAPSGVTSVQYLVVGGGGSGGSDNASAQKSGGGGGGGVVTGFATVTPGQSYTITVGAGANGVAPGASGTNGTNSTISGPGLTTITALGGGGGAGVSGSTGSAGGSGGGGVNGSAGGSGTQTSQTNPGAAQFGNAGGTGGTGGAAGGGGGGGGAGAGPTGASNQIGGNGITLTIGNITSTYGGGGGSRAPDGTQGAGGTGGGGAFANSGVAGTVNTGGGGGGSGSAGGGAGGSGIVILAFGTSTAAAPSYDSMTDVPTLSAGTASNWCTLNPVDSTGFTIANANLGITAQTGASGVTGTMSVSSGRWYWEITLGTGTERFMGIMAVPHGNQSYLTTVSAPTSVLYGQPSSGNFQLNIYTSVFNGSFTAVQSGIGTLNQNDVVGVALDLVAFTVQFYRNNLASGTAVPLTPGLTWTPWISSGNNTFNNFTATVNFGQQPFVYSPPSGFDTLNTYNLPSPTIPAGNVAVNAITYTGGSSTPPGLGQVPKRTASTLAPVNSLRFRSGNTAYLNRAPTLAGNQRTWTYSVWVKRGAQNIYAELLSAGLNNSVLMFNKDLNEGLSYYEYNGSSVTTQVNTNLLFKDASQWYHIVLAIDTTQPVAANRVIIYVNGQQATSLSSTTYPAQNYQTYLNSAISHYIGLETANARYYDGYMAEANFVDGQQLLPSAFGTTNADGQWVPIPYIGTYGTNGFRLPFTGNQTQSFNGSFNGTSQWVSTGTANSRFNLAQGDWTVEAWYYSTSTVSNNARYMVFTPGQALGADTSATNNTITVSGTPTWSQFSPYGNPTTNGSLVFNGSNQYLSVNQAVGNMGTADFTIELWWQANGSQSNYATFIGQGFTLSTTVGMWAFKPNNTNNFLAFSYCVSAVSIINVEAGPTPNDGRWHYCTASRQGTNLYLFLDGVLLTTATLPSGFSFGIGAGLPTLIGTQTRDSAYIKGNITNLRVTIGTCLYTSSFTPPSTNLAAVTNTQLLLNTVNSVLSTTDSSANAYPVTVFNSPPWSFSSPIAVPTIGGSLYFNGTNTSLQSNSSTGNFLFGNSNFTVEAWIYPLNITAYQYIASVWGVIGGPGDNAQSCWQIRINTSGNFEAVLNNGATTTVITGSTVLFLRQWQHVAMVRNGNTITLFVNGVNVNTTTYTSTLNNVPTTQFVIGQQLPSSYYFNGYMTNLRIINGTALYTTTWFTPPTAALSIVNSTQTVLLMDVNSASSYITDSSSYSQTFTVNGTLVYNPASPYSPGALGGSAYLSGSSQYFIAASNAVLAPGTGDFTIEAWIYPTSTASWLPIFQNDQVGSSSSDKFYFAWNNSNNTLGLGQHGTSNVAYTTWVPVLNTWYHLAAVRQSGVIKIFINGVQQAVTNSSIFSGISFGQNGAAIGAMSTPYYFSGYITNIRYIVGFAQYGQSFTPVTTQALSAVPGTVLLMNTTSNGLTWGLIPYNSTDFTLNLFGGSPFAFNMATVNASMKLNVWQHIALVRSGQTTTLYVDGVASAASAYPWWTNGTVSVFFGGVSGTYANYFQGQISNFRIVMGTAVYTTNFTPQTTPLSAIQGTALLTMNSSTVTDSAGVTTLTNNNSVAMAAAAPFAANVAMDASGNSNHWFPNGIGMTTGTAYDTVTDVPADTANLVANSSTLNPVNADSVATITNGNLRYTITSSASWYLVIATQAGQSGGKYYFEITITNPTQTMLGLFSSSSASRTQVSSAAPEYLFYLPAGTTQYSSNGAALATWTGSPTFATGDIAAFAYDTINGMLWLGRIPSGSSTLTWINTSGTANPATATDPRFTGVPAGLYPGSRSSYVNANGPPTLDFNFGQQPFVGTVPTGFTAINTYTNPVATAWWGNGNSYPDLTWIKSRSAGTSHMLMDSVRGPSLYLSTNTTNPQFGSGGAYNWSKYGLVLANDGNTNVAGNTYVLWGWTAGQGNAIVNTSGSISSTVSANPTAGFSIVSFNQSSAANYSIGHGLGVTPNFWIFKVLNGSYYWVGHSGLAYNQYLQVNSTAAAVTDSTVWNAPATSSVINVGSTWSSNTPNQVIAYCWTAVPGYSAFGSYTGNGSTDGPFVYTGFRPRWIMYKSTTEVSYWNVFDTARSTYNVDGPYLNPNVPDAEASTTLIDILSNGFKLRASSSGNNTSSATYIYAAFAENPFKYVLAR